MGRPIIPQRGGYQNEKKVKEHNSPRKESRSTPDGKNEQYEGAPGTLWVCEKKKKVENVNRRKNIKSPKV